MIKDFSLSLYVKRDFFPFSIVRIAYLYHNMPTETFYASLGAEFCRIARITTELEKYKSSCAKIISRMIKQRGTRRRIKQCLSRINGQNFEIFGSFLPIFCNFLKLLL